MDGLWIPGLRDDLQRAEKKVLIQINFTLSNQSPVSQEAGRKALDRLGTTVRKNWLLARGT